MEFDAIIKTLRLEGFTDSEIRKQFELAMIRKFNDDDQLEPDQYRQIVKNLIDEFGVPKRFRGYTYIVEATIMYAASQKEGKRISITKEIFPTLANMFDTTPSRVERAIRYAIKIAMKNVSNDFLKSIFGNSFTGKLTKMELISALADKIN